MLKPLSQSILSRNGLQTISLMQPVRNLTWETKKLPVDPQKYLPKLKPNQINVPVFERRFPITAPKKGTDLMPEDLTNYNWVYDRIMDKKKPLTKFPETVIILSQNVTGVGVVGTKLRMSGRRAYRDFILPQLAVYASPRNEEKYKALRAELKNTQPKYSSVSAEITTIKLKQMMIQLWMNLNNPWQVERWHLRVAFRKMGVILNDECIELPSKPITGPDLNKEGKHFFVTVTVNNQDRVAVVCRLNHYTDNADAALPSVPLWTEPFAPIFEEDVEVMKNLEVPDMSNSNPYLSGFRPFTVIED